MDKSASARGPAIVLINGKSGTVRSMGAETVHALIGNALQEWPAGSEVHVIDGSEFGQAVSRIIAEGKFKTLIAGGGDGTIASIAGQILGSDIALGILPLGTMNLVAKSLGIDGRIAEAFAQLRTADHRQIDAGRADGNIFLHTLSFGIQPRMVKIREKLGYHSRLSKMLAGGRAMLSVLLKPQSMRLRASIDGRTIDLKAPAVVISNNVCENSMWLRAGRLDGGLLGFYAVQPISTLSFLRLALDLLRGRWRENLHVREEQGRRMQIEKRHRFGGKSRKIVATLDGEIMLLSSPVEIRIEPLALEVLVPRQTEA